MESKLPYFIKGGVNNYMFPLLSIIHIKIYNHHPNTRIFHTHQSRKSECVDAYFPPMTSGHFLHGFFLRWKTFSETFFFAPTIITRQLLPSLIPVLFIVYFKQHMLFWGHLCSLNYVSFFSYTTKFHKCWFRLGLSGCFDYHSSYRIECIYLLIIN